RGQDQGDSISEEPSSCTIRVPRPRRRVSASNASTTIVIELRVGADERDYVLSELQALFQRIERNRTITDEVRSFSDAHRLSPTMTALLELAAAGLDNHQAAAELGVTLGTVSTLWRRIRKRTGCPSQREVFAS